MIVKHTRHTFQWTNVEQDGGHDGKRVLVLVS